MISEFQKNQTDRYEKVLFAYRKRLYKREPAVQINNHNTNVNFSIPGPNSSARGTVNDDMMEDDDISSNLVFKPKGFKTQRK
jgi:hypothetical protein